MILTSLVRWSCVIHHAASMWITRATRRKTLRLILSGPFWGDSGGVSVGYRRDAVAGLPTPRVRCRGYVLGVRDSGVALRELVAAAPLGVHDVAHLDPRHMRGRVSRTTPHSEIEADTGER